MKLIIQIILIICIAQEAKSQLSTNCLLEKGINIAITTAEKRSIINESYIEEGHQEIHYDEDGRVTLMKNSQNEIEFKRVYEQDRLKYMISEQNGLMDTGIVIKYYDNGNPEMLKHSNGAYQAFEYVDCEEESNIYVSSIGDTIQQYKMIFDNGIIIKTIWTPFEGGKTDIITKYYDYKFDELNNWIERKYINNNGLIVEKRKLIYF